MKYIEPAPTPIQQPPPARLLEPRIAAVDRLFDLGEGSIGPPSLHIFSFQLWQSRSSASLISVSPARRLSAARSARIFAMARAFPNSFESALRTSPETGVG
jgi:hypothetical protein